MKDFPHYTQHDAMDCGPTCLRMIARHYGKNYTLETLRERCFITREGVSMYGISEAAEGIGFRTMGVKISTEKLIEEAPLPCIMHWNQEHFVVLYKISLPGKSVLKKKSSSYENAIFHISDPSNGLVKLNRNEFEKSWLSSKENGEEVGFCLMMEPTPDFYEQEDEKQDKTKFKFLLRYLKPYKKFITQLILSLLAGSLIQLIFPFLTQAIVDNGISNRDIGFIYLVLIAQLVLYTSRTAIDFIRSWILLHISTRVNVSLISDFLIKLMRLPIRFFDTKMVGDIMQRIGDHTRIQDFLTSTSLSILFSLVNLVIFGIILAIYNMTIFLVFLLGSGLYMYWIVFFMKRRKILDYKRFNQLSHNQSNIIQLITGMQEIKINNCEREKRWEWERIQASLYKVNIKSLALNQYQKAGSVFINEVKNIIISVIAATAVINGDMTLGMMLAVQYIIGQLNSPIEQMISFMQSAQDAKISLERLGEIHEKENEDNPEHTYIDELPTDSSMRLTDLTFQYEGPQSEKVLENLSLTIPDNKITAIVGTSGSGKTTLIKLLLGFYDPVEGEINVGNNSLSKYNKRLWRKKCGVVMQEGFIFSDTIARNIAIGDETIDKTKLLNAVKIANIQTFIESLPLQYNTKIGAEGHGLSQGQKQRILIARAVYKDPKFIFLDEATNALDANNEKEIMEKMDSFFKGRTVVVVAHRLSTVTNADQIVVLEKGKIVEKGTHKELTASKGAYYKLVKNQLELGK